MAPQVFEKARLAEENGSRREVDTDVRIQFFELQKNELKRLKSLSRAQNRALTPAVDVTGSNLAPAPFTVSRVKPDESAGASRRRRDERAAKVGTEQVTAEA
jgi:hypothetical protein